MRSNRQLSRLTSKGPAAIPSALFNSRAPARDADSWQEQFPLFVEPTAHSGLAPDICQCRLPHRPCVSIPRVRGAQMQLSSKALCALRTVIKVRLGS